MSKKGKKDYRSWLFKYTAVIIGVCYLMGALHEETIEIMHHFSHSFSHKLNIHVHHNQRNRQSDHSVFDHLEHQGGFVNNHTHIPTSDTLGGTEYQENNVQRHLTHDHPFIDFVKELLHPSPSDQHTNQKVVVLTHLDKHLVVQEDFNLHLQMSFMAMNYCNKVKRTSKGILDQQIPPPKTS